MRPEKLSASADESVDHVAVERVRCRETLEEPSLLTVNDLIEGDLHDVEHAQAAGSGSVRARSSAVPLLQIFDGAVKGFD
jgi:hypothetical protein